MSLTQWRNRKTVSKQKLRLLQMLTTSAVFRPADLELRYGISLAERYSSSQSDNRTPYSLYLSGKKAGRHQA